MVSCPNCRALTGQGRNGTTAKGVQRYRCSACGRRYVLDDTRYHGDDARVEVIRYLAMGHTIRQVAAMAGVSTWSVQRWRNEVKSAAQNVEINQSSLIPLPIPRPMSLEEKMKAPVQGDEMPFTISASDVLKQL